MNPNLHPYRVLAYLVLGLAVLLSPAVITQEASAHSIRTHRVTAPQRHVETLRIAFADRSHTHAYGGGHLYVVFNDGAAWKVAECRAEDGRRCWWNAACQGNGIGRPVLKLRGRDWWLPRHVGRGC